MLKLLGAVLIITSLGRESPSADQLTPPDQPAFENASGASASVFPEKGSLGLAISRTLRTRDGERRYLIYLPGGSGPFPIVILLHGGTQNAAKVWAQTSLPTLARQQRFILVAPDGMNGQWNDGRSTTISGVASSADDVGFLRALIASVVANDRGDRSSVFMTGASNGGLMTMRYACEAADTLRGAAQVIADLPVALARTCHPARPLPWLSVAGTADPLMPFAGQASGTTRRGVEQPALLGASATFDFWARQAGCSAAERRQRLPDLDPNDGSTAEVRTRQACAGGKTSRFYVLEGAGHGWPGGSTGRLARLIGNTNRDIDAGSIIWSHFADVLRR